MAESEHAWQGFCLLPPMMGNFARSGHLGCSCTFIGGAGCICSLEEKGYGHSEKRRFVRRHVWHVQCPSLV